jgi:hypothetical protein
VPLGENMTSAVQRRLCHNLGLKRGGSGLGAGAAKDLVAERGCGVGGTM